MSQSPSPAGGEKPGFGGFFQVYLLAAVILMIYYTIDFQVSLSHDLPGPAILPAALRATHTPKPSAPSGSPDSSATVSASVSTMTSPASVIAVPEPASPSAITVPEITPQAPAPAPESATPPSASEPAIMAPQASADAASVGILIPDEPLPDIVGTPTQAQSPDTSASRSTPDALLPVPSETGSQIESAPPMEPAASGSIPATPSSIPEVGQ